MNEENPQVGQAQSRIYDSILDTVGRTPLVRLTKLSKKYGAGAEILGKCEFMNPLSSVKDRIGLAMIDAMEADGQLTPGRSVLVEPTSGNTGIALAFAAAAKGYRLILTMPETMSVERRKMLRLLGAELELTEGAKGMRGAIARAQELLDDLPDAVMPQQFSNPANPEIHRNTTAPEILQDCGGKIDVFVAGVGTGGTLTGVGQVLKTRLPNMRVVAVEPEDSAVISGGEPGPHKIQGIGAGFLPQNLDPRVIDEVIPVSNERALATARETAALEGMPVGISSGAALAAALEIAERAEMAGKRIVVVLPSAADRYISSDLFEGF